MRTNINNHILVLHTIAELEFKHSYCPIFTELQKLTGLKKPSLADAIRDLMSNELIVREEVYPAFAPRDLDAMVEAECIKKLKNGLEKFQKWQQLLEKRYKEYDKLTEESPNEGRQIWLKSVLEKQMKWKEKGSGRNVSKGLKEGVSEVSRIYERCENKLCKPRYEYKLTGAGVDYLQAHLQQQDESLIELAEASA